jgi:hypothetical protein
MPKTTPEQNKAIVLEAPSLRERNRTCVPSLRETY